MSTQQSRLTTLLIGSAMLALAALAVPQARAGIVLGDAGNYAVLALGGNGSSAQVGDLTINNSGDLAVTGDIGLGAGLPPPTTGGGTGVFQKGFLAGQLYVDPLIINNTNGNSSLSIAPDFYYNGTTTTVTPVSRALQSAVSDAFTYSASYAALPGQTALGNYDFGTGTSKTLQAGVYSATDLNFNGVTLTINGLAGSTFVLNDSGGFNFSQSQIVLTGGIGINDVLFNVTGTGTLVDVNKGSSAFQGTLLAVNRDITLDNLGVKATTDPGSGFFGRVIGSYDLSMKIHSGADVTFQQGSPQPSVPEPSTIVGVLTGLIPIGLVGLLRLRRRRVK
jgi:hypothetical protein